MNPWGVVLVAVGILLIMIGITGSQHKILQVFKGVPAAAGGASTSSSSSSSNSSSANTTSYSGASAVIA